MLAICFALLIPSRWVANTSPCFANTFPCLTDTVSCVTDTCLNLLILSIGSLILFLIVMILFLIVMILTLGSLILSLGSLILSLGLLILFLIVMILFLIVMIPSLSLLIISLVLLIFQLLCWWYPCFTDTSLILLIPLQMSPPPRVDALRGREVASHAQQSDPLCSGMISLPRRIRGGRVYKLLPGREGYTIVRETIYTGCCLSLINTHYMS